MTRDQLLGFLSAYIVPAFVTYVFAARTPEQFAAMNARLASFIKLLQAVFIDAPKALEAIQGLIHGASATRTATEEHIAKLPADIRASIPPFYLKKPERIISGFTNAVRPPPMDSGPKDKADGLEPSTFLDLSTPVDEESPTLDDGRQPRPISFKDLDLK